MQSIPLLDLAGRRRSPATTSPFHQGVTPSNKGLRYPPDPPTVEEIIAVMHAAGHDLEGVRLRGVIVVLWRAGLRISEALALNETDLDPERGAWLRPYWPKLRTLRCEVLPLVAPSGVWAWTQPGSFVQASAISSPATC